MHGQLNERIKQYNMNIHEKLIMLVLQFEEKSLNLKHSIGLVLVFSIGLNTH